MVYFRSTGISLVVYALSTVDRFFYIKDDHAWMGKMSLKKVIQIKNGDSTVPFHIYQCDILGIEIPENHGWYGNSDIHISDKGMEVLIEDWVERNGVQCGYPIILEYLLGRLTKRIKPNRYIPKELRVRVLKEYHHRCVLCLATEQLEMDHIKPMSKGGLNVFKNLQVLCKKCNREKSNK